MYLHPPFCEKRGCFRIADNSRTMCRSQPTRPNPREGFSRKGFVGFDQALNQSIFVCHLAAQPQSRHLIDLRVRRDCVW